LCSWRKN